MENLVISPSAPSSVPPEVPEALQVPTKPVSIGFSIFLAIANAAVFVCYTSIPTLLLPLQVEQMDSIHKDTLLGLGLGLAVLLALVTTPIAGALSDRTTSRFGRRRPWIFLGTMIGVLALVIMMTAGNVVMLFIGWGLFQIITNLMLAAFGSIIPDQVPDRQRGTVSAIVGLSIPIGSIAGSILIGLVFKTPARCYPFLIAVLLLILIPYCLLLRDKVLPREYSASFDPGAFLKSFWVNPRKHPDFGWAWITRFLTILSYYIGFSYFFYYLQDYLHFPHQQAQQGVATSGLALSFMMMVFIFIGGVLSDRFQRRKIFVVSANAIMALALLIYGIFPFWTIVLVASGLLGLGFGIYLAVDIALVTQVLPSAKDRAKDIGIMNIAHMLPQSLAPLVAATFIALFHSYPGYPILFITATFVCALGGVLIQPIKSVR